ncbi:hypothetical protein IX317_001306 [Fusobacterium sp. DD29]|uniref:thioesterase family protein n=1 Tax=unclassified Fusobacterium TaxID=2648384 RepID=UPI001B8D17DD|nr:hypothetical protein [Fusobacterium sp. DD29]MBR8761906.1 hypothetical protein [Fusobacterium sp. DD25]MBR8767911.1 hypothetical protein [Fusobacterium sp. DD43]MBR8771913.1 hypothetical protein [Fusobacterium sp. DD40]MBR8776187.1 hypothetical protein [Fusobacterium sp. DD17]MBR8798462.1 hypothetical protein [Fusobacterium sp. DD12]MBR8800624.1 hypothetical protein [Fusobacterium sp. DD10]MBR8804942.1 hypothetical protein [Fusobacterium sp. DD13]MBR8812116.1 hypothetical protein [Fusoba
MLEKGMTLTLEKAVGSDDTAIKLGSGGLEVFATPMLVALMENAAFNLAEKELENGDTTVGISLNIKHLKANLVGDKLKCVATLKEIDGRRLDFHVVVTHSETVVGEGEHSRFIVNGEKFLSKLKK